jgi:hypothetical protein
MTPQNPIRPQEPVLECLDKIINSKIETEMAFKASELPPLLLSETSFDEKYFRRRESRSCIVKNGENQTEDENNQIIFFTPKIPSNNNIMINDSQSIVPSRPYSTNLQQANLNSFSRRLSRIINFNVLNK